MLFLVTATGVSRTETLVRDTRSRTARALAGNSFRGRAGHTYRVRARVKDATGRWSHYSAPVEFTVTP